MQAQVHRREKNRANTSTSVQKQQGSKNKQKCVNASKILGVWYDEGECRSLSYDSLLLSKTNFGKILQLSLWIEIVSLAKDNSGFLTLPSSSVIMNSTWPTFFVLVNLCTKLTADFFQGWQNFQEGQKTYFFLKTPKRDYV
jgi:hypothetical protein